MVAARQSERAIATRLGIDGKTLRKYFREQLDRGFDTVNTEVWIKFVTLLLEDPTPARMKIWEGHQDKYAAALAAASVDPTLKERVVALGKKEQRVATAAIADNGTEWEGLLRPSSPKAVN